MLRLLSMILSLTLVICVQAIANIMQLNGKTTIEIMNRLPILFTPASYVFFIWIFIDVLLIIWLVGFWQSIRKNDANLLKLRTFLFNLSAVFNIIWVYTWHYEYFNWTIVIKIALIFTLFALYLTYPKIENTLFQRSPISIYLGWMIFTLFMNTNYLLTLSEWGGWGLSSPLWAVIFLTIATATALHFMYHHRDIALNSVFIWAFVGIAVKNGFDALFVTSAALFLTAVISASFYFVKK